MRPGPSSPWTGPPCWRCASRCRAARRPPAPRAEDPGGDARLAVGPLPGPEQEGRTRSTATTTPRRSAFAAARGHRAGVGRGPPPARPGPPDSGTLARGRGRVPTRPRPRPRLRRRDDRPGVDRGSPAPAAAALNRFDDAIELEPNQAEAHLLRGRALEELGRTDEALAAYFRSLEFAPQLGRGPARVATMQLARGEPDQALARLTP